MRLLSNDELGESFLFDVTQKLIHNTELIWHSLGFHFRSASPNGPHMIHHGTQIHTCKDWPVVHLSSSSLVCVH